MNNSTIRPTKAALQAASNNEALRRVLDEDCQSFGSLWRGELRDRLFHGTFPWPDGSATAPPPVRRDDHPTDDDDADMICRLARQCVADGFTGQNMRDPDRASAYIHMAAENPRVMDELPESGLAFWKSASFHYRLWKQQQKAKVTE